MLSPVLKDYFEDEMRQENAYHVGGSQRMLSSSIFLFSHSHFCLLNKSAIWAVFIWPWFLKNVFFLIGISQHFMLSFLHGFCYSICTSVLVLPRPWLTTLLGDFVHTHGFNDLIHIFRSGFLWDVQPYSTAWHCYLSIPLSLISTCTKLNPYHFPPILPLLL